MAFLAAGCPSSSTTETNSTDNTNSSSIPSPGNGAAGTSPAGTTTTTGKKFKLAFVTNNASDFWTIAHKGVNKAEQELGLQVEYRTPTKGAAEQTNILKDLLSKQTEGIAMSPVDPANQTGLINDTSSKALVFTQDSDAPNSKRTCYIGTNNEEAGRQAGAELKKAIPNGGNIMIFVGATDAQNAADRIKGLTEAIAGSNIKILGTRTDGTDRTRAKANVSDALVKNSDLAACVGIWSYNGPGILNAVKAANKVGKVKIVCFDEEDETLSGVKSGAISATVVQNPFEFGYQSIKNMNAYLGGDKAVVPASKQIFVPTRVINTANVDKFREELTKLRS